MKQPGWILYVSFVTLLSVAVQHGVARGQSPLPCAAPNFRDFDFWLGDWNVVEAEGGRRAAQVRVESVLSAVPFMKTIQDWTESAARA